MGNTNISSKITWQVLAGWGLLHLLFVFNERYTVTIGDRVVLNNLNENQYTIWFYNKSVHTTTEYLGHTTIKFLGFFPEWTATIIYFGYFIILGYGCYLSINEEKRAKYSAGKK
jgi:hypothetical protein